MKIQLLNIDPEKYPGELLADQTNEARVLFDIGYSYALLAQVQAALADGDREAPIDPDVAAHLSRKIGDFLAHRLGIIPEIYEAAKNLHNNGII